MKTATASLLMASTMLAGCQTQSPPPQPAGIQQTLDDLKTNFTDLNSILKGLKPPGETIVDDLAKLHADLVAGLHLVKHKDNIEQCASDAKRQYGSVADYLAASTSVTDFDARMQEKFGAWAQDPLIRLAVANRLLLAEALSSLAPSSELNTSVAAQLEDERKRFPQFMVALLKFHLRQTPLAQMMRSVADAQGKPLAPFIDSPFSIVLIGYLRAYFDGHFVNRFGTALAKPTVSAAGIPDADITGATTVLFEAVFDFLDRTPIVMSNDWTPSSDAKQPTFKSLWGEPIQPSTNLPTALAVLKETGGKPVYGPVIAVASVQTDTPVAGRLVCGITDKEARAITTLSSYIGHRVVVWSGIAVESLSTIDIGFGVGGSFAVGDNKTLVSMFKAAVEVIGRRSAEQVLFRDFYAIPEQDLGDIMNFFPKVTPATAAPAK